MFEHRLSLSSAKNVRTAGREESRRDAARQRANGPGRCGEHVARLDQVVVGGWKVVGYVAADVETPHVLVSLILSWDINRTNQR